MNEKIEKKKFEASDVTKAFWNMSIDEIEEKLKSVTGIEWKHTESDVSDEPGVNIHFVAEGDEWWAMEEPGFLLLDDNAYLNIWPYGDDGDDVIRKYQEMIYSMGNELPFNFKVIYQDGGEASSKSPIEAINYLDMHYK